MVRHILATTLLIAALAAAVPALAGDHALLIGVSEYPFLDQDAQLQGPRNDVRLMRDVLLRRGFAPERIQVLADGMDGAALPTRRAILTALDDLAGRLGAGDRLYLHLSGHGTRQPNGPDQTAPDGDHEADGQDEVFLPRDAAAWDTAAGQVRNGVDGPGSNAPALEHWRTLRVSTGCAFRAGSASSRTPSTTPADDLARARRRRTQFTPGPHSP